MLLFEFRIMLCGDFGRCSDRETLRGKGRLTRLVSKTIEAFVAAVDLDIRIVRKGLDLFLSLRGSPSVGSIVAARTNS